MCTLPFYFFGPVGPWDVILYKTCKVSRHSIGKTWPHNSWRVSRSVEQPFYRETTLLVFELHIKSIQSNHIKSIRALENPSK